MIFRLLVLLLFVGGSTMVAADVSSTQTSRPNVILIFCDNLGYGDIAPFGSTLHRTPNLDRMAAEGTKFTHFYVASGVCTPSRAALMTGCYPQRVGMALTDPDGIVLRPVSPNGLHPDEVTIAEVLRGAGYATGIVGKWHLGDQPPFLPTRQGFDEYFGVPYSDDMTPRDGTPWPPLPWMHNETVIDAPVDRDLLTRRETEAAIDFIERHREQPFFLYLPHGMPGSTKAPFSSEAFRGKSANGPFGDSVEELDWAAGEIFASLKKHGLDENTLVIWTSDNGAPRRNPPQGSNAPLAGSGYTTAEGGMRVPCLMRWPGHIAAGKTCATMFSSMDMLPTFAALAGADLPDDRRLDGYDVSDVLLGEPDAVSPYVAFYYYRARTLEAMRSGPWKLYVSGSGNASAGKLFDVVNDPGETTDLAGARENVVEQLEALAVAAKQDLGNGDDRGSGTRPVGRFEDPTPRLLSSE